MTPGEIDSPGYHAPGRFKKIRITWRILNQNRKYFKLLVSGPEAQVGSNYEKN